MGRLEQRSKSEDLPVQLNFQAFGGKVRNVDGISSTSIRDKVVIRKHYSTLLLKSESSL